MVDPRLQMMFQMTIVPVVQSMSDEEFTEVADLVTSYLDDEKRRRGIDVIESTEATLIEQSEQQVSGPVNDVQR